MTIIFPRIELFYDVKEAITPKLALEDTYQIMEQINKLSHSSSGWHLPGYDLKEIQENNVFNEHGFTEYAIKQFEESYEEDIKTIIKTLFDVGGDVELKNSIRYSSSNFDPARLGETRISISLSLKKEQFNFLQFIDFIKSLISKRHAPLIMIDVRGYSLKQKQVFPDRVYAGWMLYLPTEIAPELVAKAEEIFSVPDKEGKAGTLVITTKNIFDIENQDDIDRANDIEICLRDLGLLPLISEV
ncbi:immunity 52 family protein [Xenorhabdus nematophila]|nr:Imm52 family immunity protein [Xenorhabdus nematophila]CEF33478.1 conserved hypothetical protein [Xenorhabdus nematophila str. Websteri]AYA39115.1 hypothetical protein D3790_00150 [Xenorhabdus nematophila]KHD27482.1 hypothetical protein LH67_17830 [Xenorhabdus nematophila]MBA0017699.1 immunity 52 family protein [Xenorhabdus nematophila]MCB4426666.1 hypothetical protein [Xenorhabdus nematophila]